MMSALRAYGKLNRDAGECRLPAVLDFPKPQPRTVRIVPMKRFDLLDFFADISRSADVSP
jgi:hypothetical protein